MEKAHHAFSTNHSADLSFYSSNNNTFHKIFLEERINAQYRQDTDYRNRHSDADARQISHIHAGCRGRLPAGQELNVGNNRVQYGLDAEQLIISYLIQAVHPVVPVTKPYH